MGQKTWSVTAQSSEWANGDNWKEKKKPQDNDDIIIPASILNVTPTPVAPTFTAGTLSVEGDIAGGPITVTKNFEWSGGALMAAVELGVAVPGIVNVGDPSLELGDGASIQSAGILTITGIGTLGMYGGSTIRNTGAMTLVGQITFEHRGGAFPGVINDAGVMTFAGAATTQQPGFQFRNGAPYLRLNGGNLIANAAIEFADGGELEAAGGSLAGSGRIVLSAGGLLTCTSATVIPDPLVLVLNGGICDGGDIGQQKRRLVIKGQLLLTNGPLRGRTHITHTGRVSWPSDSKAVIEGCLVVENHVQVADNSVINIAGAGELMVAGRLSFLGNARVNGGTLTNVGLLSIEGPATKPVVLDGGTFETTDSTTPRSPTSAWPFTDGFVHRGSMTSVGTLTRTTALGSTRVTSGTWHVLNKGTTARPSLPIDILDLGVRASLRAGGNLHAKLQCAGRIEVLDNPGRVDVVWLAAVDTARLEAPSNWTAASPFLTITERLTAAGVLALSSPDHVPQFGAVATYGQVLGRFGRIDNVPAVYVSTTYEATKLDLRIEPATVGAGFDKSLWPSDVSFNSPHRAAGQRTAAWMLQELYETSDMAYLGFYLEASTGEAHHGRANHGSDGWMPHYAILNSQGWGLLPVYFGTGSMIKQPPVPPLTQQVADADAAQAVLLAQRAQLPMGCRLYLDIEMPNLATQSVLVAYIQAWCDALTLRGYEGGVYAPPHLADKVRTQRLGTLIWIAGGHGQPAGLLDDNGYIHHVEPSQNTDIAPGPDVWQWRLDNQDPWHFLDTDGVLRFPQGTSWDHDTATSADPSTPGSSATKAYNTVANLSAGTQWKRGSHNLTIQLSNPASRPNGTLVLLSSTSGEVQPPVFVRVPAETSHFDVDVDVHIASTDTQVSLLAWTPRQGLSEAAATLVKISAG